MKRSGILKKLMAAVLVLQFAWISPAAMATVGGSSTSDEDPTKRGVHIGIFGAIYTALFAHLIYDFWRWRSEEHPRPAKAEEPTEEERKAQDAREIANMLGRKHIVIRPGDMVIAIPPEHLSSVINELPPGVHEVRLSDLGLSRELINLMEEETITVWVPGENIQGRPFASGRTTLVVPREGFIIPNNLGVENMGPLSTYVPEHREDQAILIVPQEHYDGTNISTWVEAAKTSPVDDSGQALGGSVIVIPGKS